MFRASSSPRRRALLPGPPSLRLGWLAGVGACGWLGCRPAGFSRPARPAALAWGLLGWWVGAVPPSFSPVAGNAAGLGRDFDIWDRFRSKTLPNLKKNRAVGVGFDAVLRIWRCRGVIEHQTCHPISFLRGRFRACWPRGDGQVHKTVCGVGVVLGRCRAARGVRTKDEVLLAQAQVMSPKTSNKQSTSHSKKPDIFQTTYS